MTPDGSGNGFPSWLLGILPLGLLLFLLSNGDSGGSGDSSSPIRTLVSNAGETPGVTPPPSPSPTVCPTMSGGNGVVNNNQTVNSSCFNPVGAGQEMKKVPEPSAVNAVLLMTIVFCVLKINQRRSSHISG